jgi:hypothetical protein
MPFSPRYPRAVCSQCAAQARNEQGELLDFYNDDMGFGFHAVVRRTGEPHPSHICCIRGIPCYADEAYLGGIVVQVLEEK